MSSHEFFAAIKAGDADSVEHLLDCDAGLLERRDEAGATPLHYAALSGHRELVRLLVDRGADLNCLDDEFGATPAGWAIEYLRELGGVLAIEIDDLLFAIEQRDVKWVARLLHRFPSLKDQSDSNGILLKKHAESCGDERIAKLVADNTGG